jgi:hypothetical protein
MTMHAKFMSVPWKKVAFITFVLFVSIGSMSVLGLAAIGFAFCLHKLHIRGEK